MIELPATLNLSAAHLEALRQAVSFSREIAEPAALVATGSIIRGNPDPTSDLDIVILHGQPWRRRIQRRFNGTPAELFFNTQA
jgi:UTP:GlnB (protein PII) uridylyltransferase